MALNAFCCKLLCGKYSYRTFLFGITNRSLFGNMAQYEIKTVKFGDLKDKVLNGEVLFIDVREAKELKEDGKIPNSVNVPLGHIEEAFQLPESEFKCKYGIPKPGKGDDFVISCRSGRRAANAFQKLAPMGYKHISVYSGSFQDWVENGGPIEK